MSFNIQIGDYVQYGYSFYHVKKVDFKTNFIELNDLQNWSWNWTSLYNENNIKVIIPFDSKKLNVFSTLTNNDIFLNKQGDCIRIQKTNTSLKFEINWRPYYENSWYLKGIIDANSYFVSSDWIKTPLSTEKEQFKVGYWIYDSKGKLIWKILESYISINDKCYTEETISENFDLKEWFPIKQSLYIKVWDKFFPKKVLNNLMENYEYSEKDNIEENQESKELKIIYI